MNDLCSLGKRYPGKKSTHMEIGKFTYGEPSVIEYGEGAMLHIGKFCSIADNVTVMLGGNHRTDWISTYPFNVLLPGVYGGITGHPTTKGDVWIGNDVWLGRGCTIMSGVSIGNGAVVAAGSIVAKDVPAYALVAGNPAEMKKKRFGEMAEMLLLKMRWWDWDEEKIAEAVPMLQSNKIEKLYEWWRGWKDA